MHLDSPGKTLYRAIKKRSGIFVSLMHGVNIIRHSMSLCDQGIRHLSTIFVLPVMGEGGGRTRLGTQLYSIEPVIFGGRFFRDFLAWAPNLIFVVFNIVIQIPRT